MAELWDRVEELVDQAPSPRALRAHRLHLMAARLWRSQGRSVPGDWLVERRRAGMLTLAAPGLLSRARAAYDGELMLMKGPEVAAHYQDPFDRYFHDLDLLADDAPSAQRALVAAGFVEFGDPPAYNDAQHLCPLIWPGLPLIVEVHRRPNSPPWLPGVSATEVLRRGTSSATGVDGLSAPDPASHALLLAAHSWAHQPPGRLSDLIDVAAVLEAGERRRATELAQLWGWDGMWRVMVAATQAVLEGEDRRSRSLRVWSGHLVGVRDCTVLESHLARLAAPACGVPMRHKPAAVAAAVRRTASPREGERWAHKLHRTRLAMTHALMQKSKHDQTLSV